MSPIGKIFTILNLVLAALFLGWAANAVSTGNDVQKRLNDEIAQHKSTKELLGADKSAALTRATEAESQRQLMMTQRDDANARAARLEEDLKTAESNLTQLRTSVQKIEATLTDIVASRDQAAEEVKRMLQAQHDAEKARDAALAAQRESEGKLADIQAQLGTAETTIADLERTREALKKQARDLDTQLSSLVAATGISRSMITSMPMIEAHVISVATEPAPGMVALNKGRNDDVQPGFTFEIYSGSQYKGRVRVNYVHDNTASATVVTLAPGQKIRQGDNAATRL